MIVTSGTSDSRAYCYQNAALNRRTSHGAILTIRVPHACFYRPHESQAGQLSALSDSEVPAQQCQAISGQRH